MEYSALELETERLFLRPFRKEDAAAMYALNDDPEVLRYTGDTQFADIAAVEVFLETYDQYEKYGVGRLTAIEKETHEIIGWCGIKYHPDKDEYDLGYRFSKKYWGKGYATESAKACIDYASNKLGIDYLVGHVHKDNPASSRVLEKMGMAFVKDYLEDGQEWKLYTLSNPVADATF